MSAQTYHALAPSSTAEASQNQVARVLGHRLTKRQAIERFFAEHLGRKFSSAILHAHYGSSFRTRVSEINRDPAASVSISNAISANADGTEESMYWADLREANGNGR
jgi:hypothetical protein